MQKIKKHFTIKIKRGILDITKTKGQIIMLRQFKKYNMERVKSKELKTIKEKLIKLDSVTNAEERNAMIQQLEKLL